MNKLRFWKRTQHYVRPGRNASRRVIAMAAATVFFIGLAQGNSILVLNPSFETATLPLNGGNGPYNQLIPGSNAGPVDGTLADWTASATSANADGGAFAPTLGGINWSTAWWNGDNIAVLQETSPGTTASLSQTLSSVLQNGTTYSLSALIGSRSPNFGYSLQLWAGSALLTSASNLTLGADGSGSDSALYTSGSNNPHAGDNLEIVLSSTYVSGLYTEAFFDQVSLNASPSTQNAPEPSTWSLGVLALIGLFTLGMPERLVTASGKRDVAST